jgi:N-acetylglucosaminyldiphosphoundecaprenol N-acetyl-beta-D-mannosaminyltransferase
MNHDRRRIRFLGLPFDVLEPPEIIERIGQRSLADPFEYVVTPNADHVVRANKKPVLVDYYDAAWLSVCDSRILQMLARASGVRLDPLPGATLAAQLFRSIVTRDDAICVIGTDERVIAMLREKYVIGKLSHYNPPGNFASRPAEIDKCIAFVRAHPSRFVFFTVGSPQQEMLAHAVYRSGGSRGLGLCVGSGLDFASGARRRAPEFVQQARLEWLYRLVREPRRLWRRYLLDDPKIFLIALRESRRQRRR